MESHEYLKIGNHARLGFGAMRLPGYDETEKMVDTFLDGGFNYFDTAWIYGGSEETLKKALVKRHNRNKFVIADKIPPWEIKKSPEDCDVLLKKQFERTGLDYFDFYLVHSLDENREKLVEDLGLFEWAVEQKKKGLVKHVGFSYHGGTKYLGRLLEKHPETEFVQLQLNYMDIMRGAAGEWQALAIKHNVPIIVMEPIKGGSLAKFPASAEKLFKDYDPNRSIASWAVQYAATLQGATCMLSGMSSMEQMKDNLKTFKDLKPLTTEEMNLLEAVLVEASKVSSIPCTACKYCHNECPVDINIAESFSLYNEVKRGGLEWNCAMMYKTLPKRAHDCISCGACLPICPQKIDIPKELEVVANAFK